MFGWLKRIIKSVKDYRSDPGFNTTGVDQIDREPFPTVSDSLELEEKISKPPKKVL